MIDTNACRTLREREAGGCEIVPAQHHQAETMKLGSCYYLLPRFLERRDYLRDVPCIELGFPPTVSAFDEVLGNLPQIAGAILREGTQVVSIHFPHLPVTHPGFMERARIAAEFAMDVGARTITVHPHRCTSLRLVQQERCLEHLRKLNDAFGDLFAIETFDESDRVLSPLEICTHRLPMVVDVAHVESLELTRLVGRYGDQIRTVHTSIGWRQIGGKPLIAGLVAPESYPELAFLKHLAVKRWKGNALVEHEVDRFPSLVEALRFLEREVTGSVRTSRDVGDARLRAVFGELAGHHADQVTGTLDTAKLLDCARSLRKELQDRNAEPGADLHLACGISCLLLARGRVPLGGSIEETIREGREQLLLARRKRPDYTYLVRRELKNLNRMARG